MVTMTKMTYDDEYNDDNDDDEDDDDDGLMKVMGNAVV